MLKDYLVWVQETQIMKMQIVLIGLHIFLAIVRFRVQLFASWNTYRLCKVGIHIKQMFKQVLYIYYIRKINIVYCPHVQPAPVGLHVRSQDGGSQDGGSQDGVSQDGPSIPSWTQSAGSMTMPDF